MFHTRSARVRNHLGLVVHATRIRGADPTVAAPVTVSSMRDDKDQITRWDKETWLPIV
jgi:hypothetical protein